MDLRDPNTLYMYTYGTCAHAEVMSGIPECRTMMLGIMAHDPGIGLTSGTPPDKVRGLLEIAHVSI